MIDGVAMRSASRPIKINLDTPEGILYPELSLEGVARGKDGGWRLALKAHGVAGARCEHADDYDQNLVALRDRDEAVVDDCALMLAPVEEVIAGRAWHGFSMTFSFKSAKRKIHRVQIHSTWEIGGRIAGNTVYSQGQCNRPVYRGKKSTMFTTACLKRLDLYGKLHGNSFQLGPRGGLIQGFDVQAAASGTLFQYWPRLDSVSSLVESMAGSDLLHVVDEYRFALSGSVTLPEKRIVFSAGGLAEHEGFNLWKDLKDYAYGLSCARFGIAPTRVRPEAFHDYATRAEGDALWYRIGGTEVRSHDVPYLIAEKVLPVLARQGVKRFMPQVKGASDVTELGFRRKIDGGIQGDLHCASVCATHRFFPSAFWGGIAAWKAMADRAHDLGIEIGTWLAPHFSPRAPIFEEHPEYRMISVTGMPAGGGYTPQTLVVGDWNTGLADWVFEDLRRWKAEGGLDYIFTDSLSNMGLVQCNYADAMRTNFAALGKFYGRVQRELGIRSFSCECVSPWMYSRFGMADLRGDLMEQVRSVAGQNDFAWWVDDPEMMEGVMAACDPRKRTDAEKERLLFMALACGGSIMYQDLLDPKDGCSVPEWNARLYRVHGEVYEGMEARAVLPGRKGVRWTNGRDGTAVLWTFAPMARPAGRVASFDGDAWNDVTGDTLPAWGVYKF